MFEILKRYGTQFLTKIMLKDFEFEFETFYFHWLWTLPLLSLDN